MEPLVELLVDFGRELYVPWRITQGDVLYRDIAYFSGPLSPHVNALWFWSFGPGVRNVLILNFLVLAAFTWLAYRICGGLSHRLRLSHHVRRFSFCAHSRCMPRIRAST